MHSRVVGQIVGHCLIAVVQIARAERSVHHLHRCLQAMLRRPVRCRQRQSILNVRHILPEQRQLAAFL